MPAARLNFMSNPQQYTPGDLLMKVFIAQNEIAAARKQAVAMYDEDLRALKELSARVATRRTLSEPELFSSTDFLSPELQSLIDAPLARYQ